MKRVLVMALLLVGGVTGAAGAEMSAFRLDGVFGDHMVLQRTQRGQTPPGACK